MMTLWVWLLPASWMNTIFAYFRRMGALGLFLLGVGDSSFLFIPLSNDLLLIALVSSKRESWQWVIYSLAAALGSLVGVLLVDLVMRKAGEEGLEKFVGPQRLKRLKQKMEERGGWAVFFATLLPPPFPFTAIVMAASAFQTSRRGLLLAVFTGRFIRFSIVSLQSEYVEYFVYGFIIVAIIGSFLTLRKWLQARPQPAASAN
jgi:membrane protein YqaA with SNARE-associated domain